MSHTVLSPLSRSKHCFCLFSSRHQTHWLISLMFVLGFPPRPPPLVSICLALPVTNCGISRTNNDHWSPNKAQCKESACQEKKKKKRREKIAPVCWMQTQEVLLFPCVELLLFIVPPQRPSVSVWCSGIFFCLFAALYHGRAAGRGVDVSSVDVIQSGL